MKRIPWTPEMIGELVLKLAKYDLDNQFVQKAFDMEGEPATFDLISNSETFNEAYNEWTTAELDSNEEKAALRKMLEFVSLTAENAEDEILTICGCCGDDEEDMLLAIRKYAEFLYPDVS